MGCIMLLLDQLVWSAVGLVSLEQLDVILEHGENHCNVDSCRAAFTAPPIT